MDIKQQQEVDNLKKALTYQEYIYYDANPENYVTDRPYYLDGQHFKNFFRMIGDCFDELRAELYNNPNCGYITHFNDVAKEGIKLEHLSVLAKRVPASNAFSEVMASRILNALGVPTSCNIAFYETPAAPTRVIGSIDFISPGEEFIPCVDIGLSACCRSANLKNMVDEIAKTLKKDKIVKKNPELEKQIIEDLIYSYLVRRLVLGDNDFGPWNYGLLRNKENQYVKFINFDFENSFFQNRIAECEFAIEYVMKEFPHIFEKFEHMLKNLYDAVEEILPTIEDEENKKNYAILKDNIKNVIITIDLVRSKVL